MEKTIFNPASISIGMKIGEEIGGKYFNQSTSERLSFLKPYFEIDNSYIFKKMKYVILPFLYKAPDVGIESDNDGPSKEKIDFADLYLPLMSFVTYVLVNVFNIVFTEKNEFHPDILGYKLTNNFIILIFSALIYKLCKYI
jgi:hypothetical protein